ncbi:MAG: hypothetical protein Kow00109_06040 [Acidobacteriota bacterium]
MLGFTPPFSTGTRGGAPAGYPPTAADAALTPCAGLGGTFDLGLATCDLSL